MVQTHAATRSNSLAMSMLPRSARYCTAVVRTSIGVETKGSFMCLIPGCVCVCVCMCGEGGGGGVNWGMNFCGLNVIKIKKKKNKYKPQF
jgi:hypothetical protein